MEIKLAILPYGWIFVGNYKKDGKTHVLENSKNIRRSYTGKGVCDLAETGPSDDVTLDDSHTIEFKDYVAMVRCNNENWKKALGLDD